MECKGCPWRRINPSALSEIGRTNFPLEPRQKYFLDAKPECRIADHVSIYRNWKTVFRSVFHIGFIASGLLFVVSAFGAISDFDNDVLEPVKILGFVAPETFYLPMLWTTFYMAFFLLVAIDDYYKYCESLMAYWTHSQFFAAGHCTAFAVSISRCMRLPLWVKKDGQDADQRVNWRAFVLETFRNRSKYSRSRIILASSVPCLIIVLIIAFIVDHSILFDDTAKCWYAAGKMDIGMGLFQYSKILMQFLAVIVYTLGEKWNPDRTHIRYYLLFCIVCFACALGVVCIFTDAYKPRGHFMLIPRLFDQDIAGHVTELVDADVVAFLGLLEMVRVRCQAPSHSAAP